jgi:hypothetical protein
MKIKTRKSKLWRWALKKFFPGAVYEQTWLTFNQTIWTPGGISADLIVHEAVHAQQQKNFFNAIVWWIKYIRDPKFRWEQEAPAYKAQYEMIAKQIPDRNKRFKMRFDIATVMASPQYKGMCTHSQALSYLTK